MRNNRLFEIIYILLDRQKVTAKELAEKFEVSVRTIYRDIDSLSFSGIPVYAMKGKGGGIALMDDFVLQKSLLTDQERNQIMIGLQSLQATQYPETGDVISKLNVVFRQEKFDWIEVDFSDWGKAEKDKFNLLKKAVLEKRAISFQYFGGDGKKTERSVEPLRLLYKGKAWYVQGFCRQREDYRIFKLSRMKNLNMLHEKFERKEAMPPIEAKTHAPQKCVRITLFIDACMAYRVYDEFDEQNIRKCGEGFEAELVVPEDEWVYGYILSFGENAQVLQPERIKNMVRERLQKTLEQYL